MGGDPNVQSTIREGNFFLFCFKIFKNQEWNLQVFCCRGIWAGMEDKFSDRGLGQGINKNFQEGDMDGDYCKNFRRGKCTGKNVNNQEKI